MRSNPEDFASRRIRVPASVQTSSNIVFSNNQDRSSASPARQDSIAFLDQLRRDHRLHRHPEFYRTTLCVMGPRNQSWTNEIIVLLAVRMAA